ncbi:MAG: hypothetical protein R3D26_10535 [Cyanobacteriota/Melainabacteria group bacterium]
MTYSSLIKTIRNEPQSIEKISMTNGESTIQVKYRSPEREKPVPVVVPEESKEILLKELDSAGIPVDAKGWTNRFLVQHSQLLLAAHPHSCRSFIDVP